jgi:hypothetical protein
MFRRPSGVYVARLAVPMRLRPLVGRIELIQSTGSCDEAEAKVIATGALAVWRRALQELERGGSAQLDILQLTTGSPRLQMSGFLPLHEASAVSGIDQEALIRAAGDRRLALFVDPGARPGFIVPVAALDWDAETGGYDVPPGRHMPAEAVRVANPGIVQLSPGDVPLVTGDLVAGKDCELVAFTPLNQPAALYCPMNALAVSRRDLLLRTDQVERLRTALAGSVTREQIDAAKDRSQQATRTTAKEHLHVTDVLGDFRQIARVAVRRIRPGASGPHASYSPSWQATQRSAPSTGKCSGTTGTSCCRKSRPTRTRSG